MITLENIPPGQRTSIRLHNSSPYESSSTLETQIFTSNRAVAALPSPSQLPTMNTAEKHGDQEMEDVKSSVEKPSSDEVNWDGDDDPLNPTNWKASKRWLNLLVIAMVAFITYDHRCEAAVESLLISSLIDLSLQLCLRLVYHWSRKRSISPPQIWLHLSFPYLCLALQLVLWL